MRVAAGSILTLDVGGTSIGSAAVTSGLSLLEEPHSISSTNWAAREELLSTFRFAITNAMRDARLHGLSVRACCIAFPGPFDYREGISHMEHKFQSIYGFNLKTWLERHYDFPFLFLNDADAFGYGVLAKDYPIPPERLLTITLGTGVGSAYFVGGKLQDLEIWDKPYRAGILEDFISSRAIASEYTKRTQKRCVVKEIAELARHGDPVAAAVFQAFGEQLGLGLGAVVGGMCPTVISIGGSISKSSSLFRVAAEQAYQAKTGQSPAFTWKTDDAMPLYGAAFYADLLR